MKAINVVFAEGPTALAIVGKAYLILNPASVELNKVLKAEMGVDVPLTHEMFHPLHPMTEQVEQWLETHGHVFVPVGVVEGPDGQLDFAAKPDLDRTGTYMARVYEPNELIKAILALYKERRHHGR